jgi:PTS system mannose-specific IIC component
MVWKVMMVSLAGGVLCMDRIFTHVMISRPVVAGPLVGWILNDLYTGLLCGALIELLWIDRLPIGTYVPPNETITAVIITAAAIIAGGHLGQPSRGLTVFALLALLPLGYAGQQLDAWIIRSNDKLAKKAVSLAVAADVRGIERQHLKALMKSFILSVLFIFIAVTIGSWALTGIFAVLPPFVHKALTLSYFFIPLLGIAVALTTVKRKGAISLFCAVFVAMLMIWEWTYGFSR